MDTERLFKLADVIEENEDNFCMGDWWYEKDEYGDEYHPELSDILKFSVPMTCGTTACLAGWAVHLWSAEVPPPTSLSSPVWIENSWIMRSSRDVEFAMAAAHILDLDIKMANNLFFQCHLDAHGAANLVRRIAKGEDIDWSEV